MENFIEPILKAAIKITVCIIAMTVIIRGISSDYDNPLMTSIEQIPMEKVVFPAVSLNMDEQSSPWGFNMRILNMLKFECEVHLQKNRSFFKIN